ncbi:MAG: helix-turn-helix domain-containing protein [Actinomycetota bacterium]|nr:helix-turn-helix domain-containing protein [Actinomycetota bacterium]
MSERRLLSAPELADHLQVTPEWLRAAVAAEGFPCALNAGDDALFDLEAVRAWLRRPDPYGDET